MIQTDLEWAVEAAEIFRKERNRCLVKFLTGGFLDFAKNYLG